ncbi:MAG: hypothetical protein NXH82_07750 [Rhodobacteraceae bacterium]|nr:hypothetical protein [Paracoccaceae bacterium]
MSPWLRDALFFAAVYLAIQLGFAWYDGFLDPLALVANVVAATLIYASLLAVYKRLKQRGK